MSTITAPLPDWSDEEQQVTELVELASQLTAAARDELLRRLTWQHRASLNLAGIVSAAAGRQAAKVNALRQVADHLGHPPSTTEYNAERTKEMPSVSAIVKAFDGWASALIAAGLVPNAPANAYLHRVDYMRKKPHQYTDARIIECLQACARDLDRVPMVGCYLAWREEMRKRTTCDRDSFPTYQSIMKRFPTWEAALIAAGLPAEGRARAATVHYLPVPELGIAVKESNRTWYRQQQMLDALNRCARELRRRPTQRSYQAWADTTELQDPAKQAKPHYRSIVYRFGSWRKAIDAAGLRGKTA